MGEVGQLLGDGRVGSGDDEGLSWRRVLGRLLEAAQGDGGGQRGFGIRQHEYRGLGEVADEVESASQVGRHVLGLGSVPSESGCRRPGPDGEVSFGGDPSQDAKESVLLPRGHIDQWMARRQQHA